MRWAALAAVLALTIPLATGRAAPASASGITLMPSLASGQLVGTPVTWTANAGAGKFYYRFSVGIAGCCPGLVRMVRDFSPKNTFVWTPLQEGTYVISVTVSTTYTASASGLPSTSALFQVKSRVTGTSPVVSRPTANPLIALFSAPSCSAGTMVVAFRPASGGTFNYTNVAACQPPLSRNFWVAGMEPNTTYDLLDVVTNGTTVTRSKVLSFTTGSVPSSVTLPHVSVPVPPTSQSDGADGLVWYGLAGSPPTLPAGSTFAELSATDLQGNAVWYYAPTDIGSVFPINPLPGGRELVFGVDKTGAGAGNVLRMIDVAGNPLQETSIGEVDAQLAARGDEPIYGFHHDATLLPNGDTAVLGFTQQTLPVSTTPYMGDMVVVLDPNFQVAWTWDAFKYFKFFHPLPVPATQVGEFCNTDYPPGFCVTPDPGSIDWTHSNAISYSPADHNLIVSVRSQDVVIKIDYRDGAGTGAILWELGPPPERLNSFRWVPKNPGDPYPWFSDQHDVHYVNNNTLVVFDNGNTRCTDQNGNYIPGCNSHGQELVLDESTKVVTQTQDIDLGNFSFALGSAERLSNGNLHFDSGIQTGPSGPFGQAIEVLPDSGTNTSATKVYVQQETGIPVYRSFRLPNLYDGNNPPCSGPAC